MKPLAALLFALWLTVSGAVAQAAERPNFLIVVTDDQRWDALGVVQREQGAAARFPWFQTPNLDRMAADGVRFRNAFVVNSLCAPSRAIMLSGRYSHLNGVANNHTPFPTDSVTWASLLREAGYRTGYIGKWHMGQQKGQRPGFDYSASFVGQGRYEDCPFEINGESTPTTGWVDDVSTGFALDFIKQNKSQPFALFVGFKSSHGPWTPPERLNDKFADATAAPPVNAEARAPFQDKFQPRASQQGAPKKKAKKKGGPSASGEMVRNYFRTLAAVDENVGRLLDGLDSHELTENTVVIFTSDNGYFLGEHGRGDKRAAYEESLRIPLLLRYPKLAPKGQTIDAMVLNLDLAPTILDLAGVRVPSEMQGRSWRPLLQGQTNDWRKAFFYEYFYENNYAIPTILAVRSETAKLVTYPGHDDWTELFDLKADPHEMHNLVSDPAHRDLLMRMQAEFDRQAKAVEFRVPPYADMPPTP